MDFIVNIARDWTTGDYAAMMGNLEFHGPSSHRALNLLLNEMVDFGYKILAMEMEISGRTDVRYCFVIYLDYDTRTITYAKTNQIFPETGTVTVLQYQQETIEGVSAPHALNTLLNRLHTEVGEFRKV